MRVLLVSDIHSNLEAFGAVLEDAARLGGFDEVWCLGDIVGYGPDPNECIELLRKYTYVSVVGNHDLAAVGRLSTRDFNQNAALAAQWTAAHLSPQHAEFLESLPEVAKKDDFTLVHGSLRRPVWEYVVSADAARATFRLMETPFCLVGHSHMPFICREGDSEYSFDPFPVVEGYYLDKDRLIINPGGVGQPRDGDPRTSYAVYDSDERTVQGIRVSYPIEVTQEKMRRAGLPQRLIDRLSFGL